jgi:hypothetical protein
MRLIDADKIDFNEVFVGASKFAEDTRQAGKMLIDAQPTAYDVDKVIKGLERLKETEQNREDECDEEGYGDAEQIYSDGESQGKFRAYIKAIEIVKAGGIDA